MTPEKLEEIRRMTPSERLNLTLELSRKYQYCLFKGSPAKIAWRFERMRRTKEEGNRLILEGLARAELRHQSELKNEEPMSESEPGDTFNSELG